MMDFMLQAWVGSTIQRKKISWMLGKGERWSPGKKLKLLFAGYNGARNMGSDARVEEMIRQLRHVLGAENVEFSVMSQNFQPRTDISRAPARCIYLTSSRRFWRTRCRSTTA